MSDPREPVNWRRRILLSTWYAVLWGVIAGTMAAARGLFRHALPEVLQPGPAAWDLVRVPLGMFLVVFAGCFALGLAGISLRFDARWMIKNRRALWIAWAVLMLLLIAIYAVYALAAR